MSSSFVPEEIKTSEYDSGFYNLVHDMSEHLWKVVLLTAHVLERIASHPKKWPTTVWGRNPIPSESKLAQVQKMCQQEQTISRKCLDIFRERKTKIHCACYPELIKGFLTSSLFLPLFFSFYF